MAFDTPSSMLLHTTPRLICDHNKRLGRSAKRSNNNRTSENTQTMSNSGLLNLYPAALLSGGLPTVDDKRVEDICEEIHGACKGFGSDEKRLLKAMGQLRPDTRCHLPVKYKVSVKLFCCCCCCCCYCCCCCDDLRKGISVSIGHT